MTQLKVSGRFTRLLATTDIVKESPICSLCNEILEPNTALVEDLETGIIIHYRCRRLAYIYYIALHPLDSNYVIQVQFGVDIRTVQRLRAELRRGLTNGK